VHRFEADLERGGPRSEVVSTPQFVKARQRLLEALG
jgi:hypothetical protein